MSGAPDAFRAAILAAGLTPPEHILADGKLHRFSTTERRSDDAGWYVFYADGIPAGSFGCWRTGVSETWSDRNGTAWTPQQQAEHRARMEVMRQQREAEEQTRRAKAAEQAAQTWDRAHPATPDHPYLQRKGIAPHGARVLGQDLLIPMKRDGDICSLQTIAPDSTKRFQVGGQTRGAYFVLEGDRLKNHKVMLIAEGFSTGASLAEATPYAVVVAFSAGNLLEVARHCRAKLSDAKIVLCADNDYRTEGDPGLSAATEAARAVSGLVAVPDFGPNRPEGATDFNDLHQASGLDAVRRCVDAAAAPGDGTPAATTLAAELRAAGVTASPAAAQQKLGAAQASSAAKALDDFYAHLSGGVCIYLPTADFWPASSVDAAVPWPAHPSNPEKTIAPSKWLAVHRAVEQVTWCPGMPQVRRGVAVTGGGWEPNPKVSVFNLYRAPVARPGNPNDIDPWRRHLEAICPEDADHIERWLAQRIQRPGETINHALVLGGAPGIGKDSLLEPAKRAVGAWNWSEISPVQMMGRFNGWVRSVVVRVSEARDMGEVDRFTFYDHSKVYLAAPPDVLRVDEKNAREYAVFNVMGVIITTNHKTDGIYLPRDDRRHYVAWSNAAQGDFPPDYWARLWAWFDAGGADNVAAHLRQLDLSSFDVKAPPPKTPAFWEVVVANQAPEDAELGELIEALGNPDAITLEQIITRARALGMNAIADELGDRKARRALPHKMERAGYVSTRNPDAKDGLWKIDGRQVAVYGAASATPSARLLAARALRGR